MPLAVTRANSGYSVDGDRQRTAAAAVTESASHVGSKVMHALAAAALVARAGDWADGQGSDSE